MSEAASMIEGGGAADRHSFQDDNQILRTVAALLQEHHGKFGSEAKLANLISEILADALQLASMKDNGRLARALAPAVVGTVRNEIWNSKEEMVQALYPLAGQLVSAYVAESVAGLLNKTDESRDVSLLIWDIDGDLGHEIFHHIYMKGAHAACIVSDATRITTQRTAFALIDGFTDHLPGRPAILVMNKVDLLTDERAETLSAAPAVGFQAIWTSAKTGSQVSQAFQILAQQCLQRGL
jgi:GTPase SAR1 family protein